MNQTSGQGLTRRRIFELFGVGAAGVAGLAACSKDNNAVDPGARAASSTQTSNETAFHGGWPYELPPTGHFNLFTGLQNRVDMGAYLDLTIAPGGMWYWSDEKWLFMVCKGFKFTEKEFVYNVADGLTWSNGEPITAKDVETTFWCRWVMRQQEWTFIEDLRANGDKQVIFKLKNPANVVERYIVRANIFPDKSYGEWATQARDLFRSGKTMDDPEGGRINDALQGWRPKDYESEVITSGPYRYDFGTMSNTKIELHKFDRGVHADQVKFGKVVIYRGETEAITPLLLNKTVDYATHGFPLATQQKLEDAGYRVLRPATYKGPGVLFCLDKVPMFKDMLARQALAHAIDRAKAAEFSLADSGKAPPSMAGFSENLVGEWIPASDRAALNKYEYDPDKSAKLLEKAGWRKVGPTWNTPDGRQSQFKLLYPKDFLDWASTAQSVADQLTAFGIEITLDGIPSPQFTPRLPKGEFELAIEYWGWGNPHPYFSFEKDFLTDNFPVAANQLGRGMAFALTQNTATWGEIDIQKLITSAGAGLSEDAQKDGITKLAKIFNELLPKIPVYERYGNNAALEGVRVKAWPADDDPIYKNEPYSDNYAVLLLYDGRLEPA